MRSTKALAASLVAALLLAGVAGVPASAAREGGPYPAPVPGWKPLAPGEHPRLIFREGDLAAIRKRAATPEGKVILQRMDEQLARPYTTWHAAAYAFLYQLHGDRKYADKAREMAEQTLSGARNPDGRYTWPGNGQLRAGPCLSALALAYDMAYDGWDAATRKRVADGIQANRYFSEIANNPRHVPGCNHWGAHTGGLGVALLALRGDPGVDQGRIEDHLKKVVHNAKREVLEGYGTRGYYYEGHHCGRLSSNTGLIPFIQAYRIAAGQDLVDGCPNARWLVAKWVYELIRQPDGGYADLERGMYARNFQRGEQLSSDGDFAQGFGIIPDEWRGALKWTFNHVVQPGERKDYDVVEYPHHAAYALVNWPMDVPERNPGEVFPNVLHDEGPNYFIFRSGWGTPEGDLLVTALLGSKPNAGRGMGVGGSVMVAGRGLKYRFPGMFHSSRLTYKKLAEDGSGVISAMVLDNPGHKKSVPAVALPKKPTSLAVDYSKASGAELVVVQIGPQVGHQVEYWMDIKGTRPKDEKGADGYHTKTTAVTVQGEKGYVMTLQKADPPKVEVRGADIVVGGQTFTLDGEKLAMAKMAGPVAARPAPRPAPTRSDHDAPAATAAANDLRTQNLVKRMELASRYAEGGNRLGAMRIYADIARNHGDTAQGKEATRLLAELRAGR